MWTLFKGQIYAFCFQMYNENDDIMSLMLCNEINEMERNDHTFFFKLYH